MRKQKLRYFEDWLRDRLREPKFRKNYDAARIAVRLGYRIHQLRNRLDLTQADLARRMGTRQQAIARLERGDYEGFTMKTLQRIAQATGTELVIEFRRPARRAAGS